MMFTTENKVLHDFTGVLVQFGKKGETIGDPILELETTTGNIECCVCACIHTHMHTQSHNIMYTHIYSMYASQTPIKPFYHRPVITCTMLRSNNIEVEL